MTSKVKLVGMDDSPNHEADFADGQVDQEYWENPEDHEAPADIPSPMLWRVLVMPVQPRTKTQSGIVLPEMARDAESHLQVIGKVVAMGPVAFKSDKFIAGPEDRARIERGDRVADAPAIGGWVVYPRYTGQRVVFRNTKLVMMNDDEILGRANGPDGFRIYL